MLTTIGKILPFSLVKYFIKKFGNDFATLKIGNTEIKGKIWRTGQDECFFISNLAEMKQHAENQRQRLREYEDKIKKLEQED